MEPLKKLPFLSLFSQNGYRAWHDPEGCYYNEVIALEGIILCSDKYV